MKFNEQPEQVISGAEKVGRLLGSAARAGGSAIATNSSPRQITLKHPHGAAKSA